MTTATRDPAEVLEALRALGFELTRREPDRILWLYLGEGSPPRAAGPLLDELRRRKPEALEILAGGWDEERERERHEAALAWCDAQWPRGAREWAEEHRPELQRAVEGAFEAIDRTMLAHDTAGFDAALRSLRTSVTALADAYHDAHGDTWGPSGDRLEVEDGQVYRIDENTGERVAVDAAGEDVGP